MARKRLLLLITDLGPGGAERAISKLSFLLNDDYEVFLVQFDEGNEIFYPVAGTLLYLNVPTGFSIFKKALAFYGRIRALKAIKKNKKIDVSISFLEGANYINILSRSKEKVIISVRGSISKDFNIKGIGGKIRKKLLMKSLYKKADHCVVLSNGLKNDLMTNFNVREEKITTIFNHYDFDEIAKLSNRNVDGAIPKIFKNTVLITSGRLSREKGQSGLIKVFSKLLKKHTSKLMILGDGDLKNDLVSFSENLGLKTYCSWGHDALDETYDVYFMGYIQDPYPYLSKATLFLFPSLYEGLGNALVEALGCGVPVMASDCHSGPREVLAPESPPNYHLKEAEFAPYGILMPIIHDDHSEKIWADTILKVIADPALLDHYIARGLDRIKAFSKDPIKAQWKKIIEN